MRHSSTCRENAGGSNAESPATCSSFARNPEQALVERLETGEIYRALRGLSDVQQRRFLMRHLEERSIKQIAQSEGCLERAVKYSLNHARKNLREMLSEHASNTQRRSAPKG
ncbi:RNA polymerase sigma factor [Eggerthella sinensis]|uniref:RNA polymerase sigma factor n=1 Tax=Eggerthella sinensis TaxID=242230 RepID=UPI003462032C